MTFVGMTLDSPRASISLSVRTEFSGGSLGLFLPCPPGSPWLSGQGGGSLVWAQALRWMGSRAELIRGPIRVLCLNFICPLVAGVGRALGHQARVPIPGQYRSGLGKSPDQLFLGICSSAPDKHNTERHSPSCPLPGRAVGCQDGASGDLGWKAGSVLPGGVAPGKPLASQSRCYHICRRETRAQARLPLALGGDTVYHGKVLWTFHFFTPTTAPRARGFWKGSSGRARLGLGSLAGVTPCPSVYISPAVFAGSGFGSSGSGQG